MSSNGGLRGESASARELLNAMVEIDELQNKSVHKETLHKSVLQNNERLTEGVIVWREDTESS
jgi:hypothetical protein